MKHKFTLEYDGKTHTGFEASDGNGPLATLDDCDYWFGEISKSRDTEVAIATELERNLKHYLVWRSTSHDRDGKPNAWEGTVTCHKTTAEEFIGRSIT